MIDYVLTIKPLEHLEDLILSTLRLEAIEEGKGKGKRQGQISINHISPECLRYEPIAVSIVTKRGAVDEDEAFVQLSLWVSAHYIRLRQLAGPNTSLPVLPLILVLDHEWTFLLAEKQEEKQGNGERIVILQGLTLGSTKWILAIFKVIAALRRLRQWVRDEYEPWFREMLEARLSK